ncbi:MAG: YdcH family protein [Acidithiobacillus sp.]|uniref:YdcH family protein n=1 Tax=Acidithiobacillus sp. TaxID=1872118 RepID=UPI0029FBD5BF|nr:YdcH family protein [Acidithiobacillus ferrooxidans]MDD5004298.1 YdcH family protein [Acidithiobacillus sp.]MDD5379027.1 YdcH family protein [Acidithiobacillus sp.]MDD5577142.1 YdcH family protein [Acidithiobacillus sp.]
MQTEHQDLKKEFPQLATRMDVLQQSNAHFAKAFDEFNALTAEIEHIERNDATAGESVLEQMKKRRLALKDEIYRMASA